MFLPLVGLVFLFAHWRVGYRPFALSLAGLALAIVGALMLAKWLTGFFLRLEAR